MYTIKPFKKLLLILCSRDLLSEKDMNITACHKFFMSTLRKKFAYMSAKFWLFNKAFPPMSSVIQDYKTLIL